MTVDQPIAVGSPLLGLTNSRIISRFIYFGLLDRHPNLQVVSVNSGLGSRTRVSPLEVSTAARRGGLLSAIDSTDLVVALLRVTTGVVFLLHGGNHAFSPGAIDGTARWFESIRMRPGRQHAWAASVTECCGRLSLAVGLLTPLAAAALLGVMIVAFATAHPHNGFFIFRPGQGFEYVLVLMVVLICLGGVGGGRLTLDRALGVFGAGWLALVLTVGVGAVGAAAQLLAFWRPRPAPASVRTDTSEDAARAP